MRKTLMLGALAAALAAAGQSGPAAALTLKAAHYLSPKHPIGVGYQTFADELKKDTDGKITVKVFAGESLLGAKAISDGTRDRVADIGFITMTYTPSYYPHGILINDLAMVGDDDMAAAFAVSELYMLHCKPCLAEYEKQNLVFLGGLSTAPYVILAKGDVNGADKIKGKKLRAGGSLWDRFAEFAGATGVNIPTSEMYEGISRGILDGTIYAIGGLKTHGLADVVTQVVMLKLGSFRAGGLIAFNRDVWSKELNADQRKAVFEAVAIATVRTVDEYHRGDREAVELGKQKGVKIVQPDPGLQKLRDDFIEKDLPGAVKHADQELGIKDADGFVKQYRELYAKYEKLLKPIESDPAKMSDVMTKEIFAKLDAAKYEVK